MHVDKKNGIAVVAMSGVFPKAIGIDAFWNNIVQKVSAVADIPDNHWPGAVDWVYDPSSALDKTYSRKACLVDGFSFDQLDFDQLNNNLKTMLPEKLDHLHKWVIFSAWDAFKKIYSDRYEKDRIGIIMASIALPTDATSSFSLSLFENANANNSLKTKTNSTNYNFLCSRVVSSPAAAAASALGLNGSCYTLDAACASSLYALKFACDELLSNRADIMLAGGASGANTIYTQVGFSQLKALSPSGRCAPFDHAADGLVVGEGAGVIVLKRLSDALRDQDTIYGVIRGIGLSNDMRGNLLAPESQGQVRAMRNAYLQSGWTPDQVDYIECHGAGTPVGDATEIESMTRLWENLSWNRGQCAIGSVKSMIGHLLTGAGAVGLIKTLLALHHKTLPPSLNFEKAAAASPLNESPFRIQTDAEPWLKRQAAVPRRAAVNAFGFGGINAHTLIEEWIPYDPENDSKQGADRIAVCRRQPCKTDSSTLPACPVDSANCIAITGIDLKFGPIKSLKAFQEALEADRTTLKQIAPTRWRNRNILKSHLRTDTICGVFFKAIDMQIGEFKIPPGEFQDILPQQLLMLKTVAAAIKNAGLRIDDSSERMGSIIGIGFDFEATNFNLRWSLPDIAQRWHKQGLLQIEPSLIQSWLEKNRDNCGPPLTAARTLGALGSIVASRIAREFRFGGPSFTVSAEEASGLRAVELATQLLQSGATDIMVAGAVDLFCNERNLATFFSRLPLSRNNQIRPFDKDADGTLPGEGAVALVLKRRQDAVRDGDRIYGIIRGIGSAGGGRLAPEAPTPQVYELSLKKALRDASVNPDQISLYESHGSGIPSEDETESRAITAFFQKQGGCATPSIALGALKPVIGHTGATAGLASLAKSALALHHGTIAPFAQTSEPKAKESPWEKSPFHFPGKPLYFEKNNDNSNKTRKACVAAITNDGGCMHVILEQSPVLPEEAKPQGFQEQPKPPENKIIRVPVGGPLIHIEFAPQQAINPQKAPPEKNMEKENRPQQVQAGHQSSIETSLLSEDQQKIFGSLINEFNKNITATAKAHENFLNLSSQISSQYANTLNLAHRLMNSSDVSETKMISEPEAVHKGPSVVQPVKSPTVAFNREQCMEFAIGSVGKVLGPAFDIIDTYPARVRLPDEPLMLVDRIMLVEGEKCSMNKGRVVTEHDVLEDAWYLDGARAPVCISVEAGQADLFLSGYLGIDHQVKGQRTYRLLDATVTFHRGLPQPGETIRYDIHIDKFIKHGKTYLFLFNYESYIADQPFITMVDGCAGFFTQQEVQDSGGIILTDEDKEDKAPEATAGATPFSPIVPFEKTSYSDEQIESLRRGDAQDCFGNLFQGIKLPDALTLPGNRMRVIDRVLEADPHGGRWGLGYIKAEADIDPNAWFLKCHFVDDMVMPGTLMYECCAHSLRVLLLRMGWLTEKQDVAYEPVQGIACKLKCRGPVTPDTRHAHYALEIKAIGYNPEPYVIADAHMYADGHYIVFFKDMSMQLTGLCENDITSFWKHRQNGFRQAEPAPNQSQPDLFTRDQILEFATGKPSLAFGQAYKKFDHDRFIARLPAPPFSFIHGITKVEPSPWVLKPDGWVQAYYNVNPHDWYFKADQSGVMPFCVLLEIALQPCGWLAAYMGSALKSKKDLKFRNLGGQTRIHKNVYPESARLTMRTRVTKISDAADMIIENFDFEILAANTPIFDGSTYFGFFTTESLDHQIGLRVETYQTCKNERGNANVLLDKSAPLSPEQAIADKTVFQPQGLSLPSGALLMIDTVESYCKNGGPHGLGFIRGSKKINPQEWFFKAHFYQDPVCPGSLGVESFLQLVKYAALKRWPDLQPAHRFELIAGSLPQWSYRGQVIASNNKVTVDVLVTEVQEHPCPRIIADGYLYADGLAIYEMKNFGFDLVPIH
ncbi:MAG: beta-ketoacyl synthase [Desulfobacteraceae bacterium]|nr:beta-ketoacyl synthase [Desulfobacteraceae bacterium]